MDFILIKKYKEVSFWFQKNDLLIVNLNSNTFIVYDLNNHCEIFSIDRIWCYDMIDGFFLCANTEESSFSVLSKQGEVIKQFSDIKYIPYSFRIGQYFYFLGRKNEKYWFKLDLEYFELDILEQVINPRIMIFNDKGFSFRREGLFAHEFGHQVGLPHTFCE